MSAINPECHIKKCLCAICEYRCSRCMVSDKRCESGVRECKRFHEGDSYSDSEYHRNLLAQCKEKYPIEVG